MDAALPTVKALVLDERTLDHFLRSAALARVLALTTTAQWVEYQGNRPFEVIYSVLGYDKPGFVEVRTVPPQELRSRSERLYKGLWQEFADRSRLGPPNLVRWMKQVEHTFNEDRRYIKRLDLEALTLNRQVDAQLQSAINVLATVKLCSEVALLILGTTGWGAGYAIVTRLAVGVSYPVLVNVVTDFNQGQDAEMIATTAQTNFSQSMPSLSGDTATKLPDDAQTHLTGQPKVGQAAPWYTAQFWLTDKRLEEARELSRQASRKFRLAARPLSNPTARQVARAAARNRAGNELVRQAGRLRFKDMLAQIGLKTAAAPLMMASIWFTLKGTEQAANDYWSTIEQNSNMGF